MKTIKVFIAKPTNHGWPKFGEVLLETQWQTAQALNHCVSEWYIYQREKEQVKAEQGRYPTHKELPDPSKRLYKELRELYPELPSLMVSSFVRKTRLRWRADTQAIVSLSMSLPTYSKTHPIIFHNQTYTIYKDGQSRYIVTVTLRSSVFLPREQRRWAFVLNTKKLRGTQRVILQAIVDGDLKRGEADIGYNHRKKKWYFCISYTPLKKEAKVDQDVIVGVTFGTLNAYCCAVSSNGKRHRATGKEIVQYRRRIHSRKSSIQQQGNVSSRQGRGKKKYLTPIDTLFEAERRFRDSRYHQFSKAIVAFAVNNHAGTIRLGYPYEMDQDNGNAIITDWALSDLQRKITYKAKEYGIQVVNVTPPDNQHCSVCSGEISIEKDSGKFGCLECGVRGDAEYNAAKQLAQIDL